jgi:hypothetical protein
LLIPQAAMKPAYALSLLLPALPFLPGCPGDCGAFNGAGDVMVRRGDDAVFLCRNGGFVATIAGRAIQGRFEDTGAMVISANGTTGAREFSLTRGNAGAWSSAELGDGWTTDALSKTELDHADVQCAGLETQAWWTMPPGALPATAVFTVPAGGYASKADCLAAQHAGNYPANAKCEEGVMLCANGNAAMMRGDVIAMGTYSAHLGEVSASSLAGDVDGVFISDGTLHVGGSIWHQVAVAEADHDLVATGCGVGH